MRRLYSIVAYLLAPAYCSALLVRGFRERGYWRGLAERFGRGPSIAQRTLWLHAASVGEVQAAAPLARALLRKFPTAPLLITTSTPAGAARARALLGSDAVEGHAPQVRFAPLDLPGSVRRFFDRAKPRIGIVMETELWPNLFAACRARGVPLVLASARVSERSAGRYERLRRLFEPTLRCCALIAAQSEADAERFRRLVTAPGLVHVIGNIKFDFEVPGSTLERGAALRARYAHEEPLWVAGSTHAGEEEAALEAHLTVQRAYPDALLVIAPRHPPRFTEVAARLEARGVPFTRRSRDRNGPRDQNGPQPRAHVLLLDTLGELLDFYAAADVVFVGGSLVPVGGHNLLEPAALGRPIVTGPHHFNAPEIAQLLAARSAIQIVRDASELGDRVTRLISNDTVRAGLGDRAREVVEGNRGALGRLLALIEPLLTS